MNSKMNVEEQMAQGAVVWKEREEHLAVMKRLNDISYTEEVTILGEEMGEYAGERDVHYHVQSLPESELEYIVKRGNHEEIMYMIERYHHVNMCTDNGCFIPGSIQALIVKHNQPEEIEAVISEYGFCDVAQDAMFAEWPHNQLVEYSRRHGFYGKWQVFIMQNWSEDEIMAYIRRHELNREGWIALISRGKHEEIMEHIRLHDIPWGEGDILLVERGNHDEIMAMLNKNRGRSITSEIKIIERGIHSEIMTLISMDSYISADAQKMIWARGDADEFMSLMENADICDDLLGLIFTDEETKKSGYFSLYAQKNKKGLPEKYEKRFIKIASADDFITYISRHRFRENNHVFMIETRSAPEVRRYLEIYGYISDEAETLFARKGSREDKLFYYRKRPFYESEKFLDKLLQARPLDYGLLAEILLSLSGRYCQNEQAVQLMNTGTPEEVKAYIKTCGTLERRAFISLFFRNDKSLFEEYLEGRTKFFI